MVPVTLEEPLAGRSPVELMRRLGTGGRCFLLESSREGRFSGWSFLGANPDAVAPLDVDDPLRPLEAVLAERVAPTGVDLPPFVGGWVGYLGYEAARCYERLPAAPDDPLGLPLADFALFRTLVAVDHAAERVLFITQMERAAEDHAAAVARLETLRDRLDAPPPPEAPPLAWRNGVTTLELPVFADSASTMSRAAFLTAVGRCREHILAGDIYQVQISRRFSTPMAVHPFTLYTALRDLNPSPYLFHLGTPACTLVGASPETLVRVQGDEITYRPIAGTRRRGYTPEQDAAMERELRASPKEQAEHLMLVDLGRNDVGRVAAIGTVEVTEHAVVERYSHVMHLVSGIRGRLQSGRTALDALRACFPAGTVTGAPKIRAMEIIASLEPHGRGPYSGAVGYAGSGGALDTAIALRTVVVAQGRAHVQAAAGIVADSTPDEEAREIDNKASAALVALKRAGALRPRNRLTS